MHSILHFAQVLVNLPTSSLVLSIPQVIGKELGGIQSEIIGVAARALATSQSSSAIKSVVGVDTPQFVEFAIMVSLSTLALQASSFTSLGCSRLLKATVVGIHSVVQLLLDIALREFVGVIVNQLVDLKL